MINKAPTIHSYFSGVAFTAFLVAWPRRTPINKPFLVYRSLCVSPIPTSAGSAGQIIGKSWLVVAERTISEPRIDAPVARLRSSLDPFLRGSSRSKLFRTRNDDTSARFVGARSLVARLLRGSPRQTMNGLGPWAGGSLTLTATGKMAY